MSRDPPLKDKKVSVPIHIGTYINLYLSSNSHWYLYKPLSQFQFTSVPIYKPLSQFQFTSVPIYKPLSQFKFTLVPIYKPLS